MSGAALQGECFLRSGEIQQARHSSDAFSLTSTLRNVTRHVVLPSTSAQQQHMQREVDVAQRKIDEGCRELKRLEMKVAKASACAAEADEDMEACLSSVPCLDAELQVKIAELAALDGKISALGPRCADGATADFIDVASAPGQQPSRLEQLLERTRIARARLSEAWAQDRPMHGVMADNSSSMPWHELAKKVERLTAEEESLVENRDTSERARCALLCTCTDRPRGRFIAQSSRIRVAPRTDRPSHASLTHRPR